MAAALVPDAVEFNPTASPSFQCQSHKVVDPVYPTELAVPVFCSYSEVAFPGGCCRHNWVAVRA
jgi:hypothetical protein